MSKHLRHNPGEKEIAHFTDLIIIVNTCGWENGS